MKQGLIIHDQKIEDIIEDVRELRDADFHVCKQAIWQSLGEPETTQDTSCSCEEFDKVIDKLQELKYGNPQGE